MQPDPRSVLGSTKGAVFRPQRLIDLQAAEAGKIRLVATGNKDTPYVTLSYCWGKNRTQPGRTTTPNMNQRLAAPFDLNDQPKTIQEAVWVARNLGFRYLWADSLCIVQDDDNDKSVQIGDMHRIYSAAYLTISAARSNDSDHGFLANLCPPPSTAVRIKCLLPNYQAGSVILSKHTIHPDPLHQRAWALQEHLLSNRLLIFGTNNLRGSCRDRRLHNGPDFVTLGLDSAAEDLCDKGFFPPLRNWSIGRSPIGVRGLGQSGGSWCRTLLRGGCQFLVIGF